MPNKEKIRKVLKEREMTQRQLAKSLNVSTGCVSLWINGERQLNETKLKRICEVLECKAEDIW
jgi:DNA-binding Xre family transcriptional regulator